MTEKVYPNLIIKLKDKVTKAYTDVLALYTNKYGGFNCQWSRGVTGVMAGDIVIETSMDVNYTNGYTSRGIEGVYELKIKNCITGAFTNLATLTPNQFEGYDVQWAKGIDGVLVDGKEIEFSGTYASAYKYKPYKAPAVQADTDAPDL